MRNQDQIKTLKQISIMDYLANKGINPTSKSGSWFMYHSPIRDDSKPSFGVNPTKNIFNDLGSGDKGNIIELVMLMESLNFNEACKLLEDFDLVKEKEIISLSTSQNLNNKSNSQVQIIAVKPLQHYALIEYCQLRGISFKVAYQYLKEVEYSVNNEKRYFGIGFTNDKGGYAIRSKLKGGKINIGCQFYSSVEIPNSESVMIFEGFFNFLSAIEHFGRNPTMTAIILNSTSNLNKALPIISEYKKVFCFLDNDDAGRKAFEKLKQVNPNLIDQSFIYEGYNDFNEFLIAGTKPP
ncbi:toprim domain-containing protein [Arcicella sp. LKC2W]|uniref:toprim domain-containing protein n=1 Tax=Arcicella sp. LKC2W TaxID=2984198 RepID=UPI002B200741|nr:toprim domain-containing protein [Arcicella sp. LKC2W]MEA5457818.1 toprim domain-containing protein [Arcicella sp. LKC2W]